MTIYEVKVLSTGIYDNVALGSRYSLCRSSALRFYKMVKSENCDCEVIRHKTRYLGYFGCLDLFGIFFVDKKILVKGKRFLDK